MEDIAVVAISARATRESKMRKSVINGDVDFFVSEVKQGGLDINWRDQNQSTFAHLAASKGRIDILKFLTESGADLQLRDCDGCVPLHNAAAQGKKPCIRFLLSKDVDVNILDKSLATPTHKAAQNGHFSSLRLLITSGGDVHLQDTEGDTPLLKAAFGGHVKCAKHLLDVDKDVLNTPDRRGQNGVHKAVLSGSLETLELLVLSGGEVDRSDKKGVTPLLLAAENGNLAGVAFLLNHGSDVNKKNKAGMAPLHKAVEKGYIEMIVVLLDNKADVNAQDKKGRTPLHIAAKNNKLDIVKLLLSRDALQLQDSRGRTPVKLVRKHRPVWNALMGLDAKVDGDAKGKKPAITRSSDSSETNLASNMPALGVPLLPAKPLSSTVQHRPTSSKRAPLEAVLEQWNEKTSSPATAAPPSLASSSSQPAAVDSYAAPHIVVSEAAHHDVGGGGGVLGGGRTLPQGTSKSVAIDDAVSAWMGGGAPEKSRKPFVAKLLKPGDMFHRPGGLHASHSRHDPSSPRKFATLSEHDVASSSHSGPSDLHGPKEKIYTDTWGFVHSSPHHELNHRHLESESELKWMKMLKLKSFEQYQPKMAKKLLKHTVRGIPMSIRAMAWKVFCNVEEYKKEYKNKYSELSKRELEDLVTLDQIERDLHRTFPTHIYFREEGGKGQCALGRVLKAYSLYNPNLGYCQGMGFIAALFLMFMEEEDAFWCLVKMCLPGNGTFEGTREMDRGYGMEGLYQEDMPMVWECVYMYEKLIERYLPKLRDHLETMDVIAGTYAPQYFITVFLYNMTFPTVLRIWDLVLISGYNTVFLCALSLMKINEARMLSMDFDEIMQWVKLNDDSPSFNGEALIEQAITYMTRPPKIKAKEFAELREKYQETKR